MTLEYLLKQIAEQKEKIERGMLSGATTQSAIDDLAQLSAALARRVARSHGNAEPTAPKRDVA